MNRTFVAVVVAAALATALPSFAIDHDPETQSASQPRAIASSGGGVAVAVFGTGTQPATVQHEKFATGQVVMTTPDEVVLHTAKGIRDFALAQNTNEAAVPFQGERVTVGYVPERGTVQMASVQPAMATTQPAPAVAAEARPAPPKQAWHAASAAAPAQPAPAAAEPAATPVEAKAARPMARLPKTASDQPLVLVVGLLAVSAAGTLRLARHA
ncbi:MAG: hypothetical protein B7Z61_10615 [Acidobacteria bacterium 37-71-11]|nr:MAG: hypothetical protein B7Z61_10615 [Acidobacteria bacterium 37-71-11]HQT94960.1 hypothetical protein [Thermoanaerobaculaceae bacterium]